MGCLLERGFVFDGVGFSVVCFGRGYRNERNEMGDFVLKLNGWVV